MISLQFQITALYGGLLAFLMWVLAFRVIQGRVKHAVSLGDGGHPDMLERMRLFGNFTEYTPMILVLLLMVENAGYPVWVPHLIGAMLLAGRISHALGTKGDKGRTPGRFAGMILTFNALLISGGILLYEGITALI